MFFQILKKKKISKEIGVMGRSIIILLQELKLNNQHRDIIGLKPPMSSQKLQQNHKQVKVGISGNQNRNT